MAGRLGQTKKEFEQIDKDRRDAKWKIDAIEEGL